MSLSKELSAFWEWAGINFSDYSREITPDHAKQAEWEDRYPRWSELLLEARNVLSHQRILTTDELQQLIQVLALDNESESLKDWILENLREGSLICSIAEVGITSSSHHARWQSIEMLSRCEAGFTLRTLTRLWKHDAHSYVRRRALLAMFQIDVSLCEPLAREGISDPDEYIRLVSYRRLKEMGKGAMFTELLAKDLSEVVRKEALRDLSGN